MKNKLLYTFLFTLLVVAGLFAMHFLPSVSFRGEPLRRVDLLSDIRIKKEIAEPMDSDTLVLPPPVKPAFVDTCKSGMVCIEEYADSAGRGMEYFYEALGKVSSLDRPVRIAYFGDSFIEADILTGDLREMLPPYGTPFVWWMGQSLHYRFHVFRPFPSGHFQSLFYSFFRSLCKPER